MDPPVAPINFVAAPGDGQVKTTWNRDAAPPVASYELVWGVSPEQLDQSITLSGSLATHIVANLTNGTEYFFGLTAIDGNNQRSKQTPLATATPEPPSNNDPPLLTGTVPNDQAVNVALDTPFQVAFSRAMDRNSVVVNASPHIDFSALNWRDGDTVANFSSLSALQPNTTYAVSVTGLDTDGHALYSQFGFGFSTAAQ